MLRQQIAATRDTEEASGRRDHPTHPPDWRVFLRQCHHQQGRGNRYNLLMMVGVYAILYFRNAKLS